MGSDVERTIRAIALALLPIAIATAPPARAADPPATAGAESGEVAGFVHGPPLVPSVAVGSFRIVLERTTLAQAMRALGAGKIVRDGDAATSMARICYESRDASRPAHLILESDEMGGGETITGFQLFRAGVRDHRLPCTCLRLPERRIVATRGISLATRRRDILARFGPAQDAGDSTLGYAHERSWREKSRRSAAEMDEWTESSTLDLEFRGEELVWLRAWKVTSD